MEKPALTLSMQCVTRCVQRMYVCLCCLMFFGLPGPFYIWIRIQLIPIAMVMMPSLEMAGPTCILSCDAVTGGGVYHIWTLPFAIVCTLSCLQPLQ